MPPAGLLAASAPALHVFWPVGAGSALQESCHASPYIPSFRPACLPGDLPGSDTAPASASNADHTGSLPSCSLPGSSHCESTAQASPQCYEHLTPAHDPSAAGGVVCPPPFVAAELEPLEDPLNIEISVYVALGLRRLTRRLTDNGLDSQAHLLQFIVDAVRTKGVRSAYYFKGRSTEELLAFLRRDAELSNAMRVLFDRNVDDVTGMLVLIIRYICRRPPAYKSRKSVHFADETQIITPESTPAELDAGNSPPSIPPFNPEVLLQLRNPVEDEMMVISVTMFMHAKKLAGCAEAEVRFVVLLCQLLQKEYIATHLFSDLAESDLRDVVQADNRFMEHLRALLQCNLDTFYDQFCPVICYLYLPLTC